MFLLFVPYFTGDVISPTRLDGQFGLDNAVPAHDPRHFENPKFGDFSNAYLPEISAFANEPKAGSVALWDDKNQLGRPLYHVSGFSPAYLPARLIQAVVSTPTRFITVWSLALAFLSGIFIFAFCCELRLTPLACLAAALGYAASPAMLYWLAFPMFLAAWCWGAGCLWAIQRMSRCRDLVSWVALGFCAYSLLMASYPQMTVYQVYLVAGYAGWLALHKARCDRRGSLRFILLMGSAGMLAIALAAPVLADVFNATLQSARVRPGPDFFLASLQDLTSLEAVGRAVALAIMPNLYGVGTRADYPATYNGLSAPVLTSLFIVAGLVIRTRRGRGWWLPVLGLVILGAARPVYLFCVEHLGLGLSRTDPFSALLLPCVMLQAFALDALQRIPCRQQMVRIVAAGCMLLATAGGILFGLAQGWPIAWAQVFINAVLVAGVSFSIGTRFIAPAFLVASACWLALAASPTMLRQSGDEIAFRSPLVDAVRRRLPDHARFAMLAPRTLALSPNFNALVGLASVHSYDSLSSRRYQAFIRTLGGDTSTFGRWNDAISPDYAATAFWMSNIAVVISPVALSDPSLSCVTRVASLWLCDVRKRMGQTLLVDIERQPDGRIGLDIGDPRTLPWRPSRIAGDAGDRIDVDISPGRGSTLVLSQQYHPDWRAAAMVRGERMQAKTFQVNGFFQGVAVPPDADKVTLKFEPWARYAYLANYVWVLLFAAVVLNMGFRRRPNRGQAHE